VIVARRVGVLQPRATMPPPPGSPSDLARRPSLLHAMALAV